MIIKKSNTKDLGGGENFRYGGAERLVRRFSFVLSFSNLGGGGGKGWKDTSVLEYSWKMS